ncbi:MAG TPA: hypothetical protein VHV57_10400 [Acidimicrobiales bacterium]|jgi:hypothetical protein|nr:hypothetical protein [Acidimicrobiales bacterium]
MRLAELSGVPHPPEFYRRIEETEGAPPPARMGIVNRNALRS